MTKFTRGLAIALLLGAAPVGLLAAHAAQHGGWGKKMSAESIERIQDGKLAAAKTTLRLDDAQTKLWVPVEEQIRAQYKKRAEDRAEWQKKREERRAAREANEGPGGKGERGNMAERFEKMSQRFTERAEQMKAFSTAFSPFYASLNDEQKAVLGPVMKDLKIGGPGRGGKGPRWAHRGDWDGPHGGKGWGRGGPDRDGPRGDVEGAAPETPDAPTEAPAGNP